MSFLHFSCDPSEIRPLIPKGLDVDTFEGRAWVGLVPFHMLGIRPPWAPPLPWLSAFPETNVRTYVHRRGEGPGVWFLSLDAARWLACRYAQSFFGLPYRWSRMSVARSLNSHGEGTIHYHSQRPDATSDIRVRVGVPLPGPEPGSLEFFLVERYLLYAQFRGQLWSGMVHHPPYALRRLELMACDETLIRSHGLECRAWEHLCYSPGVDVEIFSVQDID